MIMPACSCHSKVNGLHALLTVHIIVHDCLPLFYHNSVHPTLPLLATGSGQRSFPRTYDSDSDCDSVIEISEEIEKSECSVKIWSLL